MRLGVQAVSRGLLILCAVSTTSLARSPQDREPSKPGAVTRVVFGNNQGVFLVYDVFSPNPDSQAHRLKSFVAYWLDNESGQLFAYDQLMSNTAGLDGALAALERGSTATMTTTAPAIPAAKEVASTRRLVPTSAAVGSAAANACLSAATINAARPATI